MKYIIKATCSHCDSVVEFEPMGDPRYQCNPICRGTPEKPHGMCIMVMKVKIENKPEIIITMEGGVIQDIEKNFTDIKVLVKDFDISEEDTNVLENKQGDKYIEKVW